MLQRSFKDPEFWFLLLMNGYLMYYYVQNPSEFNTIVWIYWLQSVLIGVFNFFDLLRIKNPDQSSLKFNNKPITKATMAGAAWFFLFHYGFFHLVYAVFLLSSNGTMINYSLLLIAAGIFLTEGILLQMRKNPTTESKKVNVGKIFILPYLRTIPMHLMILMPSFFGLATSMIFLLLKTIADIGMHLITTQKDFSIMKLLKR